MQQLPLDISLADHAVFASFHGEGNDALLHMLRELATVRRRGVLWIWGKPESGKSHLLQAAVVAADECGARGAYVPLARGLGLLPPMLDGLGELDVVCLDDVHEVAGDNAWEHALFRLFEELAQRGSRLVIAAEAGPVGTHFALRDLASRLASGPTFRIQPLDDAAKVRALQLRARFRGFELPDDTGRYLLSRAKRSTGGLFQLLDELDRAALAAQKRLTIPFAKQVLGA